MVKDIIYPVPLLEQDPSLPTQDGSIGMEMRYSSEFVKTERSTSPSLEQVDADTLVLHISSAELVIPEGNEPLLSTPYWCTAFNIVFTSDHLVASRACWYWRAGLIATITIAARIAMRPMTRRISMRVKPCLCLFVFLIRINLVINFVINC